MDRLLYSATVSAIDVLPKRRLSKTAGASSGKRDAPILYREHTMGMIGRLIVVSLITLGLFLLASKYVPKAKASDDCPVTSATPNGKGGAKVVFNCGSVIFTIQEPVWP